MRRFILTSVTAISGFILPAVALAQTTESDACPASGCRYRLTPVQLLAEAERLVSVHRFEDAAPMLKALEAVPSLAMETRFLQGYSAIESGNIDGAISNFRSILSARPDQTRVRLELARALMMKGKLGSADHHFKLAGEDKALPEDILRAVRQNRGILRDQRQWAFSLDLGFAPDSNITNGTNAETVDVNFGPFRLPLTLDPQARQKSGVGQNAAMSGSFRTALSESAKLLIETDTQATNYKGKASDDFAVQVAIGPEFALSDSSSLSVQAIGSQRWYGGKTAAQGGGVRTAAQHEFSGGQRIGFSLDARFNKSGLASAYDGWSYGAYATYERVVARSLIASANIFARREKLTSASYSGLETGASIGLGGELPLGINAGITGGISRAAFDAPIALFSNTARKDWRLNARAQIGLRSLRVLGFSPSVTYSFSQTSSSLTLYDSDRHRVRFGFARYF